MTCFPKATSSLFFVQSSGGSAAYVLLFYRKKQQANYGKNMTDIVRLLGVKGGPSLWPNSNMPTSNLLSIGGMNILVDAGLGVSKAISEAGIFLADIDAIFITHMHSDHYLELGPLLHTTWVSGQKLPIPVYGPSRLKHYLDHFLISMEDDIDLRINDEGRQDISNLISFTPLAENTAIDIGSVKVTNMKNIHPPLTDSYALRFDWQEKSVVMSGDTAFMPEMIVFAQDADLLVHEAMLSEGIDLIMSRQPKADDRLKQHLMRSHTLANDVGTIATKANVKRLALNHLVPDGFQEISDKNWEEAVRPTWSGTLFVGRDGMTITL